jgi:molecular chaperone HtpG
MPRRPDERFAYGSVLEALSRGLYPDKRHVLREFVQNAYDSIFELRKRDPKARIQPIHIKIQAPSIFIGDHGSGMRRSEVQQYRYLGYSQKQRGKHAGFRGIGKYAGIGIAKKIIVDTSPIGIPKKYRIIFHADRMMAESEQGKNAPLEEILRQHTEFKAADALTEDHYTFVELHDLSDEAGALLDENDIRAYLAQTAPVPFHPDFKHGKQIAEKLKENDTDFLAVDVLLNGNAIYKPFFPNAQQPEFDPVLFKDNEEGVLAYAWYCQNADKGQLEPKDLAGLVFRVRNIAVGDGQLSRKMLWKATPERASYFFGEIHVLDSNVVPSSDRTDFEDNHARTKLVERCGRIRSNLSRKAEQESKIRRFDEVLDESLEIVSKRERDVKSHQVPIELRDQVLYEVRQIEENVKKRLHGPKTSKTANRAKRLMGRTRRLLRSMRTHSRVFFDLSQELKFDSRLRTLYEAVVEVLKEEFADDPERLENAISRIHMYARQKLKQP